MSQLKVPEEVYAKKEAITLFNQLAIKIQMDSVSNDDYYAWLNHMIATIGEQVPGARIMEKPNARTTPPLNVAVYYDTPELDILPTGALLRTSCNKITHAFCAFKMTADEHAVRPDYRYVFDGEEKLTIQQEPASSEAVSIVKRLLARTDIKHPGHFLLTQFGIEPRRLSPVLALDSYRYTFFVWLDKRDALRCSIDRYFAYDLSIPEAQRVKQPVSEVELAIYPHIEADMAGDPRVVQLIQTLRRSLCTTFGVGVTKYIKYQRSAQALGIWAKRFGAIA